MKIFPLYFACLIAYFFILMHVLLETPGGNGLYMSFNILAWMCISIFIALGCWQISKVGKIQYSRTSLYFLLGFSFLLVPYFYGGDYVDQAIPRLLALLLGLLFWLSLLQFKQLQLKPEHLLWMILAGASIEIFIAWGQFFFLEAGDWGGYTPQEDRPFGMFLQPNILASFVGTAIVLSIYINHHCDEKKSVSPQIILTRIILFSGVLLLPLLASRVGYIGTLISLILILPFCWSKNRSRLWGNIFIVTAALLLSNVITPKATDATERALTNVSVRADIYEVSTKLLLKNLITGAGYGKFERAYLDLNNELNRQNPLRKSPLQKLSHPHNEVLLWGIEGGLSALFGLAIFCIAYLRLLKKVNWTMRSTLLALIFPILLHTQTGFPFYQSVSHFISIIILLWYSAYLAQERVYSMPIKSIFLVKFMGILQLIIAIPFLATTLHTAYIITQYEKHQYTNIEPLASIINPLAWEKRLSAHTYSVLLLQGLKEQNESKLQRYYEWATNQLGYRPRISLYANQLLVLKVLNKPKQYQQLLKQAKRTYPLVADWDLEQKLVAIQK